MVIYFTGTGNSRYVAESIAFHNNDELVSANDFIRNYKIAEFASESPYVFVSPTYAWRIPRIFSDFIENGTFAGNDSVYFVMTYGTDIGNANLYLRKLCERKNFKYKGVTGVLMPENYIAMFEATEEAKSKLIIDEADKTILGISEIIANGKSLPIESSGIIANIKSRFINPVFYFSAVSAKGFSVTDKCISCGKCEKLCPLGNIKLQNGKPVYGERCTHCMACICACPTEAIEYKKRTIDKPRYYNDKNPSLSK